MKELFSVTYRKDKNKQAITSYMTEEQYRDLAGTGAIVEKCNLAVVYKVDVPSRTRIPQSRQISLLDYDGLAEYLTVASNTLTATAYIVRTCPDSDCIPHFTNMLGLAEARAREGVVAVESRLSSYQYSRLRELLLIYHQGALIEARRNGAL